MDQTVVIPAVVVVAACFAACITDVREFKIRNVLTLPLLVSGLAYHGIHGGGTELGASRDGALVGFAIFFVPYLIGVMGAGDVKLMAAIGAWLGVPATCVIAVVGCLAAGIYSTFVLVRQKRLMDSWTALQLAVMRLRLIGQHLALDDEQGCIRSEVRQPGRYRRLIPFSVMITIGVLTLLTVILWSRPVKAEKIAGVHASTPNQAGNEFRKWMIYSSLQSYRILVAQ